MLDHMKKLEEENKVMRIALAEYKLNPSDMLAEQQQKKDILLNLLSVFHSGDDAQLTNYVQNVTCENCLLLTPSLFQELRGRNAVVHFWHLILEAFPDGLFKLSETTVEDNNFVSSKFTFTGTKVSSLPSDAMIDRWKLFVAKSSLSLASRNFPSSSSSIDSSSYNVSSSSMKLDKVLLNTASDPYPPPQSSSLLSLSSSLSSQSQLHAHAATAVSSTSSSSSTSLHIPDNTHSIIDNSYSNSNSAIHVIDEKIDKSNSLLTSITKDKFPNIAMSGYLAITLDTNKKVNRFIFVWNSTSLIGQILGLSNGDLEAVSKYFNKSAKELSI